MARSIRLSVDEAWAELAGAHTGLLTTLRRDGRPVTLPVWFVALDRRIYVSGPAHTKKFVRLRNDDRVSFLVESGERWRDLMGVHVSGRAHVVDDPSVLERVAAALHEKYAAFRTPRDEMPDAVRANYETEATTVEIVPEERILTWHNARLFEEAPS